MASGVDPAALRAARENAGLTQHQLARLIGVAGGERVSRWELGTSEPRPEFLHPLAAALEVTPSQLLRLEGSVPDLRALRLGAGLSVKDLVEKTHLSTPTYLRWESGRWTRLPEQSARKALAAVLGVPATTLVEAFREAQRLRRG